MKLTNRGKCLQYRLLAFFVYFIPMAILFAVNIGAYTTDKGKTIGFWGFIIVAFVILTFKNLIIDAFKKRTQITLSVAVLILSVIFKYISEELTLIAVVSLMASVLSSFVEVVADTYDSASYVIKDGVKLKNTATAIPDKQAWAISYGFIAVVEEDKENK